MTYDPDLKEIGKNLIEYASEDAEFSAHRGAIDELFPFIYQASKRMSTRAISRWLSEEQGVKLSAVTIAKALREAGKNWERYWDRIEPVARIVEDSNDFKLEQFLFDDELFEKMIRDKPVVSANPDEQWEYENATSTLTEEWFSLDESTREQCWKVVRGKEVESDEGGDDK